MRNEGIIEEGRREGGGQARKLPRGNIEPGQIRRKN